MPTPASARTELVGCCVIGPKHEESGVPCQDACQYRRLSNGHVVIAVGDGVGSADLSHVGATIATEVVAGALRDAYESADTIDRPRARWIFHSAFQRARTALVDEAADRGIDLPELDTTLHAVVAGPSGIAGAGVGDGGAIYHDAGSYEKLYPREMEIAEVESPHETHPLTLKSWEPFYRFGHTATGERVAVFSDGLESWTWDGLGVNAGFFASAFDLIADADHVESAEEDLHDALTNENFRRSRDDKSFVLARWGPQTTLQSDEATAADAPGTQDGSDSTTPSAGDGTAAVSSKSASTPTAAPPTSADAGPSTTSTAAVATADASDATETSDTTADDGSVEADETSEGDDSHQIPIFNVDVREETIVLTLGSPPFDPIPGGLTQLVLAKPPIISWNWKLKRLFRAYDITPDSIDNIIGERIPCEVTTQNGHVSVRIDWEQLKTVSDYPAVRVINFPARNR